VTAEDPARDRGWYAAAAVAALAILAHSPALFGGWIWDDSANLTKCEAVASWSGLARIWTDPSATQQYYPLTYTTFWLEHKAWGFHPAGFHAVNVLLHAVNALLLLVAFRRLGLGGAAAFLGAALFAVHPVHAESVAWATERRNVLSMALYLGSGLSWLRWSGLAEGDRAPPGRHRTWIAAFVLFLLALLAKSAVVTLPPLLLVVAWWRRGCITKRDILSLLPFFAASVAAGLLTMHLERSQVGAVGEAWELGPAQRLLVAGRALWFYAAKLAFPVGLSAVYPRWSPDPAALATWLFPSAALALPVALFAFRDRIGRGPLAAALAFGGTLFPVLGFLDVYYFLFSFVADHFLYHASPALLAPAAVGLARAVAALDRVRPRAGAALSAVVVGVLGVACAVRATDFRDDVTLWTRTLERHPRTWIALSNLGSTALAEGRVEEAAGYFERSLAEYDRDHEAWNNLGICLVELERPREAVAAFAKFAMLRPGSVMALENLGRALLFAGDRARAVEVLERATSLPGAGPDTHASLLAALRLGDDNARTLAACRAARERFPDDDRFLFPLVALLLHEGKSGEAVALASAAVARTGRGDARLLDMLAVALAAAGRFEEAVRTAEEAQRTGPGPELAEAIRTHLEAFRRGEPAHK
jgi:Flp pilus assembly protein TadD